MAFALLEAASSGGDFLKKNSKYLALLVVLLAIWWWFKPYFNLLFGIIPDDAKLRSGGGDVTQAFYDSRKATAERLNDTLSGNALLNSGRCEALYDALKWNPNQLRVIHNAYKNNFGVTLYSDLSDSYTDDCGFLGLSDGLNTTLMKTLESLNLT